MLSEPQYTLPLGDTTHEVTNTPLTSYSSIYNHHQQRTLTTVRLACGLSLVMLTSAFAQDSTSGGSSNYSAQHHPVLRQQPKTVSQQGGRCRTRNNCTISSTNPSALSSARISAFSPLAKCSDTIEGQSKGQHRITHVTPLTQATQTKVHFP